MCSQNPLILVFLSSSEILDRQLNPSSAQTKTPAWGAPAATGGIQKGTKMRDIMFEESAADLEGGNLDDDDLSDLIVNPHPPPSKVSPWPVCIGLICVYNI